MRQKHVIDLETARKVAAAADYEALQHGLQVVIAIVDDGGHLLYLQRDAAQAGSVEVALGKAKSAALFRRPTRAFEEMVENGRQGYLAMPKVMPLEGGEPLVFQGEIVGAIGISGASSTEDGEIARAGASAIQ
ncbi:MAG TPA: heme-binding protein [Gammaproteobacteria bacterium]|nr:heme-binding protein [Gammaproteobacteria bacterium]